MLRFRGFLGFPPQPPSCSIFLKYLFIYSAALGLSCVIWDLLLQCTDSSRGAWAPEHAGSVAAARA